MNSFKFTAIAVSIAFLFVIGISQSQADFEIETMYPTYGVSSYNYWSNYYEYTGDFYDNVYVKTSEPYYTISWYINGKYVGYTPGDNVKTEAYYYMGGNPGSPHGKVYTIEAVALSLFDENIDNHHSDTSSFDVEVKSERISDFYTGGGFTDSYMEVFVDVGWNGNTAEIVVGGVIMNYSAEDGLYYGLRGQYRVGRKSKRGNFLNEYISGTLTKAGGIKKKSIVKGKGNVVYSERGTTTDSYTLSGNFPRESVYYVEAQMTATARYLNAKRKKDQDEIVVDEHRELRFPENE